MFLVASSLCAYLMGVPAVCHTLQDGHVLEQNCSSLALYGNLSQRGGLWSLTGSSCEGGLRVAYAKGLLRGPILELFALEKASLLEFLEVGALTYYLRSSPACWQAYTCRVSQNFRVIINRIFIPMVYTVGILTKGSVPTECPIP